VIDEWGEREKLLERKTVKNQNSNQRAKRERRRIIKIVNHHFTPSYTFLFPTSSICKAIKALDWAKMQSF
jgi:hypothetical protein